VVVPDEQLSLAIGRRGQNVRLASQLIGWDIDILTEQEESERRQKEFTERSSLFMAALDVDEMVAQLLASEGFSSVEELAYIDANEIASIEGFDEETAGEIQNRAAEYLAAIDQAHDEARKKLGVADELYEIAGLTAAMLEALGKDDIKTVEDFAGCAADDLIGWSERKDGETKRFEGTFKDFPISREEAEDMIMQARLKAGWINEEDLPPLEGGEDAAEFTDEATA
jgi:N utilization substance protein A